MDERYDVVVVGGGSAGLSGAVALARFRRSVLVVDAGEPRNATAEHVHNFLSRDGMAPAEIYAGGRAEVVRYGGHVEAGRVAGLWRNGADFGVELGDRSVTARRVLVATGLRDELPDIPGLAARWGVDVLHCPYCHGWEVRDQRIGVLSTSPMAMHQALLFRQLSARVAFLQHTGPLLSDEQREQLDALGIAVYDGEVCEVESGSAGLTGVRIVDGTRIDLDALVVAPRLAVSVELITPLGLTPVDVRMGEDVVGTRIDADATGATSVRGLWVAGNVTDPKAQVIAAATAGLAAAAAINADLVAEDTNRAVESHRYESVFGEQAWEDRYRASPRRWSGDPNPVLVTEAAGLPPGTALDAGAGEGGDACWLAGRGWQVTAVDLSTTALRRAADQAERLGLDVTWKHLDLTRQPPAGTYDLVSAFFLQLPPEQRGTTVARLAAAVASGGTLLVVGHDPRDVHAFAPGHGHPEMLWTAEEIADSLGEGWTIECAEARPRSGIGPDGSEVTVHDAVLRARRNG